MAYGVLTKRRNGLRYVLAGQVRDDAADAAELALRRRPDARIIWITKGNLTTSFSEEEVRSYDRTEEAHRALRQREQMLAALQLAGAD